MPPAVRRRHIVAQRPPGCGPALLLVPGPTLPELDGLADMLLLLLLWVAPEPMPVVVPFLCLVEVMGLVAPAPTLPSLEAPGAGCICAKAPPVDNAMMQADIMISFFMLDSCH